MRLQSLCIVCLLICLLAPSALADKNDERIASLEDEIAELRAQVVALEEQCGDTLTASLRKIDARLNRLEAQVRKTAQTATPKRQARAAVSQELEREAQGALRAIHDAVAALDVEDAKAKLKEFKAKYGATRTAGRARALESEISVIGQDAPGDYGIELWLQGQDQIQLDSSKPTILVFWEIWCPHCRREVPRLQALYETYREKGFQVLGLTKLSRNRTDADVRNFLGENKVTYPVAKESGDASRHFRVRGVPAAAIVKDGKIVWRGHPVRLSDETLEKLK